MHPLGGVTAVSLLTGRLSEEALLCPQAATLKLPQLEILTGSSTCYFSTAGNKQKADPSAEGHTRGWGGGGVLGYNKRQLSSFRAHVRKLGYLAHLRPQKWTVLQQKVQSTQQKATDLSITLEWRDDSLRTHTPSNGSEVNANSLILQCDFYQSNFDRLCKFLFSPVINKMTFNKKQQEQERNR